MSIKDNNFKLSVILPAFNEEKNIPIVIKKTINALNDLKCPGEIIVIDDGSTDNTAGEVESILSSTPQLCLIKHKINKGLTESLMTGFSHARGDIIIFLCADLQSDPEEDIPKLVNPIRMGYDVVLGWRQGRKNRVMVSKIGHLLCRLLFGISLHDMNWIKAFKREVIKDLPLRSDWHRYIAILAKTAGYNITEVKTNYYSRRYGKSKFGRKRIIAGFLDLVTIKFQISFMKRPMFFFGTIGLIFLSSGFLLGIVILGYIIYTGLSISPSKGWYILLLLLFIVGLSFFSLGFLAEFMVTINERIKSLGNNKD